MKIKGQGIVEYALIAVLIAVIAIVILAVLKPNLGGSRAVEGQVIKTFTMSCQNCINGFATVHQGNGEDVVLEMDAGKYGLVNAGDTCTFTVSSYNWVYEAHCVAAKDR